RMVVLGVLCAVQCAVLLAIVHFGNGLRGPWLAMFGVLVLASVVGLLLGLVVFTLIRTPATVIVVLLLGFLPMIVLGGRIWPVSPAVRAVAAVMPSRWAFEGLLVQEADASPTWRAPDDDGRVVPIDLAEPFFAAESERMGPKADAMALGCMLVGLAAA